MADYRKGDKVRVTFEGTVTKYYQATLQARVSGPGNYAWVFDAENLELIKRAEDWDPDQSVGTVRRFTEGAYESRVIVKTSSKSPGLESWSFLDKASTYTSGQQDGWHNTDDASHLASRTVVIGMVPGFEPAPVKLRAFSDREEPRNHAWYEVAPDRFVWAPSVLDALVRGPDDGMTLKQVERAYGPLKPLDEE